MFPGKLLMLCELEWPTFGVNRLPEGTLDLLTVRTIYQIIIETLRHPNNFPYIDCWLQVAQAMPPGVRFCVNIKGQSRVIMAQVKKSKDQKPTKPVLEGDPEDELPVPPLYIPTVPPSSEQPVPPFPDSLPPSVSPPQPCQQPPSPSDIPHPSLAWRDKSTAPETLDAEACAREATFDAQPIWDFNTAEGRGVLTQYCTTLLHRLELRDLPTCLKLWQLSRSQRKHQLIFMRDSVRPSGCILSLIWKYEKTSE
jgi:hypothetical protein